MSRDGMNVNLPQSVDRQIVNQIEANTLNDFVSSIFEDENIDERLGDINGIIADSAAMLGEAAKPIVAAAHIRVETAARLLSGIDYPVVQTAIAHDLKGAP
ncbi:MAG: hypothetical protein OXN84_12945 [Albidovulum sp.]|nr:hypothetical protein [Albidovulum sp.]